MLDDEPAKMAAWSTHKRLLRLSSRVSPAAAIFQRRIEQLLQGIPGICNYLDDFIVTGKNRERHISNLSQLFQKLINSNLKVNLALSKKVCYLGHVISKKCIKKSKDKVKARMDFSL